MNLFIFCIIDRMGVLKTIQVNRDGQKHELYYHLYATIGREIGESLSLNSLESEGYVPFNHKIYWYSMITLFDEGGSLFFLTDTPTQLQFCKTALDYMVNGVQFYDTRGDLTYLNKTCQKIEELEVDAVIGKNILEIYEVDREYSTVVSTLESRTKIINRCDIFQTKEGKHLFELNTGVPVFDNRHFMGVIDLIYNAESFSVMNVKEEIIRTHMRKQRKPSRIKHQIEERYSTFDDIIGESPAILAAVQLAKKVAVNDVSVLLYGETGVGKEIFAQSIHSGSPRRNKEFMAINCAALPSTIIEGLLFGTTKGAFTGSVEARGLFEVADGGSIFLDEINSMDIQLQSKLLRVIQEKTFRKLGSTKTLVCNIRFITAMNEAPEVAIQNAHLRSDLYYRLATISIEIPPLRQRKQDITQLAIEHLTYLSKKYFRDIGEITPEAMERLIQYPWPGNVRELFQALEYACNMTDGFSIQEGDLPIRMRDQSVPELLPLIAQPIKPHLSLSTEVVGTLDEQLRFFEQKILERALSEHGCNITKSAESLGIKRQNLQYRIKKCGIKITTQLSTEM